MNQRWNLGFAVLALLAASAALEAGDIPKPLSVSQRDAPPLVKGEQRATPPPPDPDVIRQGGDTCATATVITALPYVDQGTTAGYSNDYDATCPYSGSFSPDVVYSYTPLVNMVVDFSLCTGTTDYDTKLYIFEDSCPGTVVACDDDSCSSPLFSDYVSSLACVSLTAGRTYNIVVDGYGSASGDYTLALTMGVPPPPPPECTGDDLLVLQIADEPVCSWSAAASGQTTASDFTIADNFDASQIATIHAFRFYGLSLRDQGEWTACDPTGMTFDVRFYADAAGEPGAETCAYAGVLPAVVAGGFTYDGYPLYRWDLDPLAAPCDPADAAWVSAKSLTNANDCAFFWMSAGGGDGDSLQRDASSGSWTSTGHDRALCVHGTPTPVDLQAFTAR